MWGFIVYYTIRLTLLFSLCILICMTINEVAKLANVSSATVSRVINSSGPVSTGTVERVNRAISKIGYVPKPFETRPGPRVGNHVYHSGRNRKQTGVIALVMCMKPSFLAHAPVLLSAVHGVEDALTQRGLDMVQVYVQPGNPVPSILSNGDIDGSLVIRTMPDVVDAVLGRHACVTLMSEATPERDHIFCDNNGIGILAFDYLKKRGHRNVAFMTWHKEHPASITRRESFCRAAEKSQLQVDLFEHSNKWGDDLLDKPQIMESMCVTTVEQMLKLDEMPTGLFVPADAITASLYPVLKHYGIMPGKDLDILSCNNETTLLAGLYPRPATIDIKAEYIGRRAVEQLCWRIQNPDDPTIIDMKIKAELVV